MRISDWSSDVCSSDLRGVVHEGDAQDARFRVEAEGLDDAVAIEVAGAGGDAAGGQACQHLGGRLVLGVDGHRRRALGGVGRAEHPDVVALAQPVQQRCRQSHLLAAHEVVHAMPTLGWPNRAWRSEEHTSELQSLMRNSYAVFCLKKKKKRTHKDQ